MGLRTAQELIKVGVMHTTSPQRAQRPDGTVPSVLEFMRQTQLQQVRFQSPTYGLSLTVPTRSAER